MDLLECLKIVDLSDLPAKRKNKIHAKQHNRHIIFCHTIKRQDPEYIETFTEHHQQLFNTSFYNHTLSLTLTTTFTFQITYTLF
jgi:hypothetical protein